jgi:uncharacterized protein
MALIELSLSENNLIAKHKTEINFIRFNSFKLFPERKKEVIIWNDKCNAVLMGKEYDDWFSDALKTKCRLVFMPDDERRIVEKKYVVRR